jgi:hypothetical protein
MVRLRQPLVDRLVEPVERLPLLLAALAVLDFHSLAVQVVQTKVQLLQVVLAVLCICMVFKWLLVVP